jgi:alpha-beta hydrolase superfamily lysophospholipase
VTQARLPMLFVAVSLWADDPVALSPRGRAQSIVRLQPAAGTPRATVVFLPGDGGWRGAAVTMARMIMTWGYDVYGFDTRKYLEVFSQNGTKLSQSQLADDLRVLAAQLRGGSPRPIVFVGWSQGAGMAVAAATGLGVKSPIQGVITLALPESAVLGWDWKATLAIIARHEPDQPVFSVKPLLRGIAPTPVWMIHGSEDEYTSLEAERVLFEAVSEPKRFDAIAGANHRFDGHQDQLYRSLKAGLEWIVGK